MKQTNVFSLAFIGLMMMQFALVGCNKPKQREETIDKAIQENLVEVSTLHDMTSETTKAYFYTTNTNEVISVDKTPQIRADENIVRVLGMIKNQETKQTLDTHLSSGLIGFVILTDQVKIFKVLTKAEANTDQQANSSLGLLDIKKMKKASLESGNLKTTASQIELSESKNDIQYIEIAAIKISKAGVLETKLTKYYDEKTSILTVGERPLDVSTHLLLEPEKTPEASTK